MASSSGTSGTRKAENRLTAIRTQEVSMVDHAANLTQFVVRKAADTRGKMDPIKKDDAAAPPAAAPPAGQDAPLSMPQGAKDSLLQLVATVIDGASKIGDALNGATVDESQPVPGGVLAALGQLAQMIEAAEAQYAPAGSEPADKAKEPPPENDGADGSKTDGDPAEETKKGMLVEDKRFVNCMKAAGIPERLQKNLVAEISKAGRKMSSGRLTMLKEISAMGASLQSMIGRLVKEVDDESKAAEGEVAPTTAAAPAPAPAAPITAAADGSPATGGAPAGSAPVAKSALDLPEVREMFDKVNATMTRFAEIQKSQGELAARINKALGAPAAPTASPTDSGSPGSKAPISGSETVQKAAGAVHWPADLAEEVCKELTPSKKKNGAIAGG